MNLQGFKQACQDEINLVPEIEGYRLTNTFNINASRRNQYPLVWMPYPDTRKLTESKGDEEWKVSYAVYDLRNQKSEDEIIKRMDELEVLANKVFRDLPINHTDIKGYTAGVDVLKGDNFWNDKLIGVEFTFTLVLWTGWDCL